MYWASSSRPTAALALTWGVRLGFDAPMNRLANRFRGNPFALVVLMLQLAAALGFVDRTLHRLRHFVGVQNHLGIDVAGRTADGLHQGRLAA